MKIIDYARVSTVEQVHGYSIDAQIDANHEWAARNGHEIIKDFIEPGRSAKTDHRPVFLSAINFVLAGGADAILVHRADRFARNLFDYLRYRSKLEASDKIILSATETFFNTSTPETRLLSSVIMAVAEFIAARIGQETIKGTQQKAKSGKWPGGKPGRGYIRIDKDTIDIDPDDGLAMSQAFRDFSTGIYTLDQWRHEAAKRGLLSSTGKPMSKAVWHNIFTSIFYLGKFEWNDEIYIGDHPALTDQTTFDAIQEILLERNSGGKVKKHFWLLKGLLWSTVYHKSMSGSKGYYHSYYRAKGSGPEHSVREDALTEKAISLLDHIKWDQERRFNAPEKWRTAIRIAPNLRAVWDDLKYREEKQELLNVIFTKRGIKVESGGSISQATLKRGFTMID